MPSCFADGCRHAAGRSDCHFYRFPTDATQRQLWTNFCGYVIPPDTSTHALTDFFYATVNHQ